jgi:RNA polymerase sigma factor (TIGR02999 family)
VAGTTNSAEVTTLLKAWSHGDRAALDRLTSLLYDELRSLAHRYMRRERGGHSLQTTGLVSEAFLRLVDVKGIDWQDRGHFLAVSARIMRRILVEAARARASAKRGGGLARVDHSAGTDLDAIVAPRSERAEELCALDDALEALAHMDPRRAQVIELRFFGGLTIEETADVLNTSRQTVMRDWQLARAWLSRELRR